MVVIVGRVGCPCLTYAVLNVNLLQEIGIGWVEPFFFVVETVETNVLQSAGTTGGSESVGLGSLNRYLAPLRLGKRTGAAYRHATLIELLAITQNILADFT